MKTMFPRLLCALTLGLLFLACSSNKVEVGQIITPQGEMLFTLYEETPLHKESFLTLAKENYWDTLIFNRVIDGFVIQGGCPDTREGFGDSPYLVKPEFHEHIKHTYGAVGAGRDNNAEKLSAGCQLYIVDNKEGIPRLDMNYMIFGQLFKGFDVLEAISVVETDSTNTPFTPVPMDVNVIKMSPEEIEAAREEI